MTVGLQIEAGSGAAAVEARLAEWVEQRFVERVWRRDPTLWSADPIPELADRLGWLDLPERMDTIGRSLEAFGRGLASEGLRNVVVLGMGGSSLAPEVYQAILGNEESHPSLEVLDSTHPAAIRALDERISLHHSLFIVSSKSGTTLETLSFFRYFWDRVSQAVDSPGERFTAVTDPGSSLETLATERGFRKVFHAPSDVGGRYSALTEFGLVPAAAIGANIPALQRGAALAAKACMTAGAHGENPGLGLGGFLGEMALAGRDKATFIAAPRLQPLVAWIEQLVAESTGKNGIGIIPVGGDDKNARFGTDRAFVAIDLDHDTLDATLEPLRDAGHPVARLRLSDIEDLGGAMFVLEFAIAAAGAALGINPFDQPDVQFAKELARRAMAGELDTADVVELDALDPDLETHVRNWLSDIDTPEYVGIHAFLPPNVATKAALDTARRAIRDGRGVATTFDFGPRFLHSTGQLHKGGPPVGRFLQIIDHPHPPIAVPETDYTFDKLIGAQALGDYQALTDRRQRVLLVGLGEAGAEGLQAVLKAVVAAAPE